MREEQQDPFSGILSHEEKVDLVPSNLELSALEMSLVTAMSRESVMKNYLSQVKDRYDYRAGKARGVGCARRKHQPGSWTAHSGDL